MFVEMGTRQVLIEHGNLGLHFLWSDTGQLNGILASAFSFNTLFALEPPDLLQPQTLRRPRLVGANLRRPDGSPALVGYAPGEHARFELTWPDRPRLTQAECDSAGM